MDSNSHGSLTSLKDIEAAATAAGISPNELQELFFSAKAQCPAFSQGCPYAKFTNIEAPAHNLTAQCPAFQNGCPFSHKSPEQVVELLRNVPHGHKACPALQHGKVNNLPTCSDGETLLNALQNLRLDLFVLDNGHDEENMPAPIALAQELRSGTAKFHRLAQRSAFIKRYTRGELDKEVYAQFLLSLHCVYSALEKALEQHKDHKGLKLIYFDGKLRRLPAIEEDLHFYLGDSWQDRIGQVPKAAQAYADRLTELSKTNPNLLVAHSYTRYLGDLSGGQILAKKTRKHLELPSDQGTSFYEFHTIDDVNAFKDIYRAALNEIPVDNETRDAIVNEAKYAYELNVNVFEAHEHLLTANTAKRGQDDGQLRRSIGKYIAIGAWIAVAVAFLHHRGAFNALRK